MAANWILEAVRYYRRLGFFSQYSDLSDEALAEQLEALVEGEWAERFTASQSELRIEDEWSEMLRSPDDVPYADLTLLRTDGTRVWWEDTEADVCAANRVYTETLRAWAGISRGAFSPQEITETWESEEGPITVRFTLDGHERVLHPEYADDWLDQRIVVPINRWIRKSGYAFEMYDAFDQTAFVVVLTPEEKRKLEQERGWRFAWPSPRQYFQPENESLPKWMLLWPLSFAVAFVITFGLVPYLPDPLRIPAAIFVLSLGAAVPALVGAWLQWRR
jgi:hypothetical protein